MDSSVKKTYPRTIVIPVKQEMWSALRKIAFDKHTSMNFLIRNAIEKIIRKNVDA